LGKGREASVAAVCEALGNPMRNSQHQTGPEDQFAGEKAGAIVATLIGLLLLVGVALIVSGLAG
jgi:hypothetical protein